MNDQRIYNNVNGANAMQQGNQQQEAYEPLKLEVTTPDEFSPTFETRYTTTQDLCKRINKMFKGAIGDYFGSTLLPNQMTGNMELCIYLKDTGNTDKIKMIEPVVNMQNPRSNDMASRIANLNQRNMGKTIQLTKEAKEIFDDFLAKPYNNQKVNWNQHAAEVSEQVSQFGNRYNIYLKLYNLNLYAVLSKIWGNKAPEGGRYEYAMNIVKQVPGTNNFIVVVQRFHNNNIEEFASQVGLTPTVGNFNIVQ